MCPRKRKSPLSRHEDMALVGRAPVLRPGSSEGAITARPHVGHVGPLCWVLLWQPSSGPEAASRGARSGEIIPKWWAASIGIGSGVGPIRHPLSRGFMKRSLTLFSGLPLAATEVAVAGTNRCRKR